MELFKLEKLNYDALTVDSAGRTKKVPVLHDISFSINEGEFVVITGATGSGKTSLLRLLKNEMSKSGNIIGYVGQNPEHQCVTDKVWHELAFGLENMGMDKNQIRRRVAETATYFDLDELFMRDTDTLSGGEKQMLVLAAVMVMQPAILLLDEPVSQLDPMAAKKFMDTLRKINCELGISIVLVEHNISEVFSYADRLIVLNSGTILCDTKISEINREEVYKKIPATVENAFPVGLRLYNATGRNGEAPLSLTDGREYLRNIVQNNGSITKPKENYAGQSGENVLSAKNIYFRYSKKQRYIIDDFSINLKEGEIYCLLGGNGAGKTTALKTLCGVLKKTEGQIKCSKKISMLKQDVESCFVKDTVREEIECVKKNFPDKASDEMLSRVFEKILRKPDCHPYDLSGGEKQLLALYLLLISNPDILLLDEPAKGLDYESKKEFVRVIKALSQSGKTIVIVTHDVELAAEISDRIGLCFRGCIVAEDTPKKFFEDNMFILPDAVKVSKDILPDVLTFDELLEKVGGTR